MSDVPISVPLEFPRREPQDVAWRLRWNASYFLWLLLVIAVALFSVRGLYRGVSPHLTNDFFSIYSISKAWIAGEAPYSTAVIVRTFEGASGYTLGRNTLAQASKYSALPGMVPMATPFTVLRWWAANSAFVIFSSAVLVVMLWMFVRHYRASRNEALAFFICCLGLGPLHTALSGSNVTPLLVGVMGISYRFMQQGRLVAAGILLGVVGCSKPHIAGAMVLMLLVDKEWKILGVAVLTGFASVAVFVARVWAAGVPWWSGFLERTRQFGAMGDVNDFSLANPSRYELMNLQVILGSITSSRSIANLVAIGVGVVLVAAWWVAVRRNGKPDLIAFAAINVILMLPSYHRFNDASVLVFLFAAAFLRSARFLIRGLAVVTALLFAFPVPAALAYLTETNRMPRHLLASSAFQLTFLAVNIWFLLLAAVILVVACYNPAKIHSSDCAT